TGNAGCRNIADVLRGYVDGLPANLKPSDGALAVAGPVRGDRIEMTNLGWSFSCEDLRTELGLQVLKVVNDFTAVAMSLPFLTTGELVQNGGHERRDDSVMGVLGPGTGLGVSGLVPVTGGWAALSGEGGHVTLAATNDREAAIISLVRSRHGHVSAERLVSGFGLRNIYTALATLSGAPDEQPSPEEISARAESGEQLARDALEHFFAFLGTTAGNLALTLGAHGGIFIAGGIIPRLKDAFLRSCFRERFEGKGRYQEYMARIPAFLILDKVPAFKGLAAILDGHMVNPCRN
ncbi:MAG: glucokinase, partial [Gammaproteobacteria bacterium]